MKNKYLIIALSIFLAIAVTMGAHFSYFFKGVWKYLSALTRQPHR